MSTDTPPSTKITLRYEDDHWIAKDEQRDVFVEAPTREQALEALDVAVASHTGEGASDYEIDPDDPFFAAPTFSSGRSDVSENVDEYLADAIYRDKMDSDDDDA